MTNKVLLNNVDHHDLKVTPLHTPEFGENVNQALIFPTEFVDIQRQYPILFRKDPESQAFQSVALLGLDKNENLFLNDDGWCTDYIPAIFARGPFSIALQEQEMDGELRKEPKIHVDLDDPRVSKTDGHPVFLQHGGNSPFLEEVNTILRRIYNGLAVNEQMFAAFEALELLEPVNIEVKVNENRQYRIDNYYTISEERLVNLDGESLEKLNNAGFLRCAYMALASLGRMSRLIEIKKKKELSE